MMGFEKEALFFYSIHLQHNTAQKRSNGIDIAGALFPYVIQQEESG